MRGDSRPLPKHVSALVSFLFGQRRANFDVRLPAISLFSGGGISDVGYELAGFEFVVQAELDSKRMTLCAKNFPRAVSVVGDLQVTWEAVVRAYLEKQPGTRLALLAVTPPCQGMSSSNPYRGRRQVARERDRRNRLLLEAVPVIRELQPRVVVVENVPAILTEPYTTDVQGRTVSIVEAFAEHVPEYHFFGRIVQMADYGVPQDRRRAIIVAVHAREEWAHWLSVAGVGPWPAPTHASEPEDGLLPWVTIEEWLTIMKYRPLDARSRETARDPEDPLHVVPVYKGDYYWRVADIPPRSGRSAYENAYCRECGRQDVPEGTALCPYCGAIMHNRPYVVEKDGRVRLVKGRKSSYRRMRPDEPARTITTASSHVGSDYKIHPWENRVLSVRECADLQTIPRFYDWSWVLETRRLYLARQIIGEALPPWFTYLQGGLLRRLLSGERVLESEFARLRWFKQASLAEE